MTQEDAIKMMKARLKCLESDTRYEDCDNHCEECYLNYEQGTIEQQIEWMKVTIQVLEDSCKNELAIERYQDLVDYFDDENAAKIILEDREEFKKWLARIKWHVQKADELARKLEQEPCEDVISRQAVLDNAYAYGNGLEPEGYCVNVEDIQALLPVTPTQKTGHWKWEEDWTPSTPAGPAECNYAGWICSECEESPDEYTDWDDPDEKPTYKCCPNCGAKMLEQVIVQENTTDDNIKHAMAFQSVIPIRKVEVEKPF